MITESWLKENYKWFAVLSVGILLLVGCFYWIQLRPAKIRKVCAEEAYKDGWYVHSDDKFRVCVLKNGVKP